MYISIEIVQQNLDWEEIVQRVQLAEDLGFDGAWVFDHFRPLGGASDGPCLEGWTLLAALAAATSRIRLGTLVTGITYRSPSVLAAQAVTVDHISAGRLELGVGAAWFEGEHQQLGIPFPGTRERTERLEEAIAVMHLLMTEDDAAFAGRYYTLQDATFRPRPIQKPHPPLWIGAQGERRMLPIVARQADVWHASAVLDVMLRKSALIDEFARRAGRAPRDIARAGSLPWREGVEAMQRLTDSFAAGGFSHLVVAGWDGDRGALENFGRTALPEIRATDPRTATG